jgi:O-antigen ligase
MQWRMSTIPYSGPTAKFLPLSVMLVGMAPALMVLLPWDFGPDMNAYRGFMRGLSLTVTLVEILFILIALARGFSLFAAIRKLPELSKLGAALFLVTAIAGAALSAKVPIYALIGIGKIVIHGIFFLALRHEVVVGGRKFREALWLATGSGVLAYCLLWIANIVIYQPSGNDWIGLVPGLPHVRGIGFFALAGFFAGYCIYATADGGERPKITSAAGIAMSIVALVLVIWTGSRGSLLAIIAGSIFVFVSAPTIRGKFAKYFGITAFLAIVVSQPLPIVHDAYGLQRIISSSSPIVDGDDPSSGRTQMWLGTIEKIKERPIFGWGVEQFAIAGPERTLGFKQPHNMILQLLFSTGVLGLLAMLMTVIPLASKIELGQPYPERLAARGYVAGALMFGLYDAAFYYPYPVMVFAIAAAIMLAPEKQLPASGR